ncbi:MAG: BamA/TamA family outer membrane protein, partial [Candidatus Marinimicrobia bacterium]|nr:BamA/TamA family outer membrane protein [Candidatus Neomarinimicrobiota bacterium]
INKTLNVKFGKIKYNDGFNIRLLKLEREKIKYLYFAEGYLGCQVKDSLFLDSEDILNIDFIISEGEIFILDNIFTYGNEVFSKDEIIEILGLRFDKHFNIFDFQKKIKLLENEYYQLGYAFVNINYEIGNNSKLIIEITIDENEKYSINNINITGNKKVKKEIIKKQIRIKQNDIYNVDKIKKSRKKIIELGMFNSVNILTKNRNVDSQLVDLNVKISESLEHRWDINLGFRQGMVEFVNYSYIYSQLDWRHKNIFHRAHQLGVSNSLNLSLNQISESVDIDFSYDTKLTYRIPIIWKYHLPTTFSLFYRKDVYSPFSKREIDENDVLITNGLSITSRYMPNKKFQISMGYTLRKIESILTIENFELQNRFILTANFDSRDNFLFPQNGWNITAYTDLVDGFEENITQYIRWEIAVSKYFQVYNKSVFANRIVIGRIYNYSEFDPLTAMFRMGTETSVRGWDQSIGNEYYTKDSLKIYAGYNKIMGNIEFRIPLFWMFGAEFFVDAGQNQNDFKDISAFDDFFISAGAGIRFNSPVGPIRFEMPFVINDPSGEKYFGEQTEIKYLIAILFSF